MKEDVEKLKTEVDKAISSIKNSRYSPKKDDNIARYNRVRVLEEISSRLNWILKRNGNREE